MLLHPWGFSGRNTGVGCRILFQGSFLTQGSNPCLLHWQADSLPLSQQGSPTISVFGSKLRKDCIYRQVLTEKIICRLLEQILQDSNVGECKSLWFSGTEFPRLGRDFLWIHSIIHHSCLPQIPPPTLGFWGQLSVPALYEQLTLDRINTSLPRWKCTLTFKYAEWW